MTKNQGTRTTAANANNMRHPQLRAALHSAATYAGRALADEIRLGDDMPFELVEHRKGDRIPLYSYKPLVGLYVERYAEMISELPAVIEASHAIVGVWGIESYLEGRGVVRPPADMHERANLAVRVFLERLFEEDGDFEFDDARFERCFAELDAVLTQSATETTVVIPISGLRLQMGMVALSRGVAIQKASTLRSEAPEMALAGPTGEEADAIVTLRWEAAPGEPETPQRAVEAARRLICALRLHFEYAAPAAGPLIWIRPAGGPWRAMTLGGNFRSRGCATVGTEDVPMLRQFVELVARRLPERGDLAWALRRWTVALDRDTSTETLTDLLLAARAILEPEGSGTRHLAGRIAALCAEGEQRNELASRIAHLCNEERNLIYGRGRMGENLEPAIDELNNCVRGILRDGVCGYLEGNLAKLADDILDGLAEQLEAEDEWRVLTADDAEQVRAARPSRSALREALRAQTTAERAAMKPDSTAEESLESETAPSRQAETQQPVAASDYVGEFLEHSIVDEDLVIRRVQPEDATQNSLDISEIGSFHANTEFESEWSELDAPSELLEEVRADFEERIEVSLDSEVSAEHSYYEHTEFENIYGPSSSEESATGTVEQVTTTTQTETGSEDADLWLDQTWTEAAVKAPKPEDDDTGTWPFAAAI